MSAPAANGNAASAASASTTSPSSSASAPCAPTYGNLLGATVLDDNVRHLSDFFYQHALLGSDVEIEGKLGLLFHKKKESRIYLDGVKSLTCLVSDEIPETSFAAEIDANMFRHINEDLLQRRYLDDAAWARTHNAKPFWSYRHLRLTDKFYSVNGEHVRVTYDDAAEGRVVESIIKEKLQHVEFWSGKAKTIDFRVSASREKKGHSSGICKGSGTC
jgi:hypothetical protein